MYNLLAQVDISQEFNSPFGKSKTIGDLVSLILKSSFVIAGVFVLILFLIAGFSVVASAGNSNPESAQKSKSAITSAVIGFVVIFTAYWIVRLIEVVTGSPFVTQPTF